MLASLAWLMGVYVRTVYVRRTLSFCETSFKTVYTGATQSTYHIIDLDPVASLALSSLAEVNFQFQVVQRGNS